MRGLHTRVRKLEYHVGLQACPACGAGAVGDEADFVVEVYGLPPKPGHDPARFHAHNAPRSTPCNTCGRVPVTVELKGLADMPRRLAGVAAGR